MIGGNMTAIEEAKNLKNKIHNALLEMNFDREYYNESEVLFRLEAIKGMLIIAHNDAQDLVKFWEKG